MMRSHARRPPPSPWIRWSAPLCTAIVVIVLLSSSVEWPTEELHIATQNEPRAQRIQRNAVPVNKYPSQLFDAELSKVMVVGHEGCTLT